MHTAQFRLKSLLCKGLPVVVAATLSLVASASSHREAPYIATQPKLDATDFYMFRSYETGRADFVTIIANYQPLQDAYGGPNYFTMDQDGLYEIHIDQNGDAVEDLTFQFRFRNTLKDIALPIGSKNVSIPLIQAGGISSVNPGTLNLRETYSIDVVRGDRRLGTRGAVANAIDGSTVFDKPADNIGVKTFGSVAAYQTYASRHQYSITVPGCTGTGKVFVGQRQDPFAVNLGRIFDLINLNPLGAQDQNANTIADKNVTTIALELPIACVKAASSNIVGAWTTASQRQARLLNGAPTSGHVTPPKNGGAWTQVSRLGMPLVNEVVIGLKDKDKFNAAKPKDDGQFADYVTNPTLPALINILFKDAVGLPNLAPTNFPRTDLVAAFLTGVEGVNKPTGVVASEMLRLNLGLAPTPKATQSNLGVLGGDLAGFPNGRRPGDDVVDAALRVAMGVLCVATGANDALKVGCKASDAPIGGAPLVDGALQSAAQFADTFPYLNTPLPGSR